MKTKPAQVPFAQTLDPFAFSLRPASSELQVGELATLSFIANSENISSWARPAWARRIWPLP